jgi:hypothetical protein
MKIKRNLSEAFKICGSKLLKGIRWIFHCKTMKWEWRSVWSRQVATVPANDDCEVWTLQAAGNAWRITVSSRTLVDLTTWPHPNYIPSPANHLIFGTPMCVPAIQSIYIQWRYSCGHASGWVHSQRPQHSQPTSHDGMMAPTLSHLLCCLYIFTHAITRSVSKGLTAS